MAILVNWFEVTFDVKEFFLPYVDCQNWESSKEILDNHPSEEIARARRPDKSVRAYFVTGTPTNNENKEVLQTTSSRSVIPRIIEYDLGKYLESTGMRVFTSRWGVEATRKVQQFPEIGLEIYQGISAKYFAVSEPGLSHGITLNWVVRPVFSAPISNLPTDHTYEGFPVILRWPTSKGPCPEPLAPFNQHYIGTIIERPDKGGFKVLVRDHSVHEIDGGALFLEARTDVLNEMEQIITKRSGQPSIQRRLLQLSHSLKPDGRRNAGILRDQLHSSLKTIDPSDRGQVGVPLLPNASGKMWINCFATGARPS